MQKNQSREKISLSNVQRLCEQREELQLQQPQSETLYNDL